MGIDPAGDFLSLPFGPDQADAPELLDVMRNSRFHDTDLLCKLTDERRRTFIHKAHGPRLAAGRQTKEYAQAVGIGKRLEDFGKLIDGYVFIIRHILIY